MQTYVSSPSGTSQHVHAARSTQLLKSSTATAGRQRGRICASPTSSAVAAQYKRIPEAKGGLPWIGQLFRTSSDQFFRLIADDFDALGSRCLSMTLLGQEIICLRHPDDVAAMCKNADIWVKPKNWQKLNRWIGDSLVTVPDGQMHARAREILAPAFKTQSVKTLVPLFAEVAQHMTNIVKAKEGQEMELETLTRRATLDVIGHAAFGYDFQALSMLANKWQVDTSDTASKGSGSPAVDVESCIDVVKVLDDVLTPAMLLYQDLPIPDSWIPGYAGYVAGVEKLDQVVEQVVKERRSFGVSADDRSLLAFMLRAQQADPTGIVTDKHIRDELMTFMFAGSDTTASTLAFCLFEIAKRPEVQARLQHDIREGLKDTPLDKVNPDVFMSMPYLTACINESLRLYPAVTALGKTNVLDQVLGEHFVPKGSTVLAFNYSMHRHPDFWPRPTEWLPERWLPENLKALGAKHPDAFNPFSAGPRSCIGRYFAVLEMQVIIAVLLRQVSLKSIPGKEDPKLYNYFTLNSNFNLFVQPSAV